MRAHRATGWLPVDAPVAGRALRTAAAVADRLADPDAVRAVVCADGNVGVFADHPWNPLGLSHGYPGTMLLFGELDRQFPDQGWDRKGRAHVLALLRELESAGFPEASLFGGGAGISLALWALSRDRSRYRPAADKLDAALLAGTERLLGEIGLLDGGSSMAAYDAIQGIAGITRYLLVMPDGSPVLRLALEYLVSLARPLEIDGRSVPAWYVPADRQFTAADQATFPHGNVNVGLSHGIAGPLAVLAIAWQLGSRVPGQQQAIQALADWLVDQQTDDGTGPVWPPRIAAEALDGPGAVLPHLQPSWCYGVPGIARALHLAGQALGEASYSRTALAAGLAVLDRQRDRDRLEAPTVCHGKAGLLQFLLRMHDDTGNPGLRAGATELTAQLVDAFDETVPFGYQDLEQHAGSAVRLDKAGVLEGAAGVALALCSAGSRQPPVWDYALLLA